MTPPQTVRLKHSPWLVLVSMCLGFFMILLDTTIVNIAVPDLSASLDASLDEILWILNAYVLVYAVLLITAGRLGDLYGPKRLFLGGLALFTLASVACGFAHDPTQLIVARIIQGVGGALLTPQTLATITVIFPADKRGAAFGIWGAVAGVATVAGPTLGGLLVTRLGWEWVFFVNLPVGIVALVLASVVMPEVRLNRRHKLDLAGTALATVGLFLLTYGLIEGQPHDWGRVWGPVTIPMLLVAAVVVLAVFGIHQRVQRSGEPLLPLVIFRDRNFSLMNFAAGTMGFAMVGLFLPLVIYLQSVRGFSALQAGLITAPMPLVSMVLAPFVGRLADRFGGKYLLAAGIAIFATGMSIVVTSADLDASRWDLLPGLLVGGVGLGMTFAPLQTIAMRDIRPQLAGAASGLINTMRQLGAVLGSAAVGALLQHQLANRLPVAAREHADGIPPQFRDEFVRGFTEASTGGLEVGAGQSGVRVPPDVPEQARAAIQQAAQATFHQAFTGAMRVSLFLPIGLLALAALTCLLARRRPAATAEPAPQPAGTPVVR